MNLALHPIDVTFYKLVLDTPTTNLEPKCSSSLPGPKPYSSSFPKYQPVTQASKKLSPNCTLN